MSTPETVETGAELAAFEEAWADFFASMRRLKGRPPRRRASSASPSSSCSSPSPSSRRCRSASSRSPPGVAPPTATRMLDGLERDGIVVRAPSAEDRRKVTVELTDEGLKLVRKKKRQISARRKAVYDSLSDSEREQAVHLLHRFAGLLEEL